VSTEDRGDNFTPTNDDVVAVPAEPKIETPVEIPAEPKAEEPAETPAEPKVETPAEPKTEEDTKPRFIPLNRHEKVLEKEREARVAAERKVADLQAQLKQVDASADVKKLEGEINELEKQHGKLLIDGDHEKAAELMAQIRMKERVIQTQEAANMTEKARAQAREDIRMDMAIDSLKTTYPALNEDNEETYDQEKVDDVLDWQEVYMKRGMDASAALVKAAAKVMSIAEKPTDQPAPEPEGLAAGKKKVDDRKTEAVARNVAAAKAQPPSTKEVGIDSDKAGIINKVDVSRLSQEEFAALPEATKASLRGDTL
jgi:hypothetical protein